MLEKYLKKTSFENQEDFLKNFELIVPERFNFAYDVVDEWARIEPNKRAICWVNDKGEHIDFTFSQIKESSDKTASYFQSIGIKKGDKVMLILKRRYEFWYCILALHKIGAICIPATHLLTTKDIEYRCNVASIDAVVCVGEKAILTRVADAKAESPSLKHLISIGPEVPEGFESFQVGIASAPHFEPIKDVNENNDSMLLYFTSGTTGEPKMVVHNFLYPLGHIVTGAIWHNLNPESLHFTLADTGWGKAVWGKLYGQWISGAAVFVYDHEKFSPATTLEMIEKYHVTSFCAPPTVFRFLLHEKLENYNLSALKWCTIAGEALNPSIFRDFYDATGIELHEGFGQTETTCSILTTPWMKPKPGSMGCPNPQYKMDLLNAEGKPAKAGEQGEIVIHLDEGKPIGLFKEYYREPEMTQRACNNNVYYTGDIATRDEDGFFWFVGRNDDVIKSSGYRIGPFEVENAVLSHPAVIECAITGVPDEKRGQIVKATIVLAQAFKDKAGDLLKRSIQDHVKKETAAYKYPRVVEFVEELPKTISGKIRRVELREQVKKISETIDQVNGMMKESVKKISEMLPKSSTKDTHSTKNPPSSHNGGDMLSNIH